MSDRLTRVYRAVALALTAATLVACSTTQATGRAKAHSAASRSTASADLLSQRSPDDIFVQLREAARANDAPRATALAAMLSGYDVPSYVQYFQIKPRMFDRSGKALIDAPDADIRAFLRTYDGQAIADRLRNDWLLVLGKRHDWQTFDAEYPKFVLDDDTQVKCYALMSRAARGENVTQAATDLLTTPKYYGEGCVDMINTLAASGQLPRKEVWHQIRLAYEENYTSLGKQIADALGATRPDDSLLDMAGGEQFLQRRGQSVAGRARHRLGQHRHARGVVAESDGDHLVPSGRKRQALGDGAGVEDSCGAARGRLESRAHRH